MKTKLNNVISIIVDNRGKNPPYYVKNGIPIIDNYLIFNNYYPNIKNVNRYIDLDTYKHFIRMKTIKDDVLLTLVGNGLGNCCLSPENTTIIQNTIGLRCKNEIMLQKFLYYTLISHTDAIKGLNRGASQPSAKVSDILSMEIEVPNLPTQQHIVDSIGSVDDAIEKNEGIIEKIKAYGNKLFSTTDASECIDTNNIIKFEKGIEIGSTNYYNKEIENSIPYIRVGNLLNNTYDTFCIDNNYKKCSYDDILIAFDGAPGRNSIGLCGVYSSGIYKVKCNNQLKGFVYFYINSNLCQDTIKQNSQGTTILHASKSIKLLKIPHIDNVILTNQFNNLYNLLIGLYKKQTSLKRIKQNLLNKYFD